MLIHHLIFPYVVASMVVVVEGASKHRSRNIFVKIIVVYTDVRVHSGGVDIALQIPERVALQTPECLHSRFNIAELLCVLANRVTAKLRLPQCSFFARRHHLLIREHLLTFWGAVRLLTHRSTS